MSAITKTIAVFQKELIQLLRDRSTFAMILMIPIVQLVVFGYAINMDPKHLRTAVISRDNSIFSRSIITGLKNSEYFLIDREVHSEEEGRLLLQTGETEFVITIPENFSRDLIRGKNPSLLVEADATNPTTTGGALGVLEGILESIMQRDIKGALSVLKANKTPADIIIHKLYNPEGITRYNIVPGLLGIILMITGILMTSLALTRERERGTMENLLAMPVSPLEIMIGKITPYVIIGYIQAGIIIVSARVLFDIPIFGSLWLLSFALVIFIICNLATGFTISAFAKNQTQAMQMSIMVFLPSLMLSGFMFPFQGMPQWAQTLGNCFPMTYCIRICRGIILKGNTLDEIWHDLWSLLIFMVLITAVTVRFYKKTLD